MTHKSGLFALLASAFVLAACGSSETNLEVSNIVKDLGKRIVAKDTSAEGQKAVQAITRAQVDAFAQPLLRVRLEGTGAMSTLAEVDRKGTNSTYMTGDGVALTFRGGILTGTRGLGQDLMGLEAVDLQTAVRQGQTQRNYRYLDGEEQLETVSLTCVTKRAPYGELVVLERGYRVAKITQQCQTSEGTAPQNAVSFENIYWVESSTGRIRKSTQYVSPKFGRAEIEVLKFDE